VSKTHAFAHKWNSFVIDPVGYIAHLHKELEAAGVTFIRKAVESLDECYDLPEVGRVDVVVNATSLGARWLKGVEDKAVHAARGDMVLLRAPHVRHAILKMDMWADEAGSGKGAAPGKKSGIAFIIPRPGGDLAMLGGTYFPNDYSATPNLTEGYGVLERCYDLDPLLAGTEGKSWRDIEVVRYLSTLRPVRTGGPRIEIEHRKVEGRSVGVVHAYGMGAVGFIAHIGVGDEVARLTKELKA
jgi:hypothetical protein